MVVSSARLRQGACQLSLGPTMCSLARACSLERQPGLIYGLQVMEIPSHPWVTCSDNEL